MERSVRLLAVLSIAIISVPAFAQEQLNLGDAFRFFPDGAYRSFGACNLVAARTAEAYPAYEQLFGGGWSSSRNLVLGIAMPLPDKYRDLADSYAYAQVSSIKALTRRQEMIDTLSSEESKKIDPKKLKQIEHTLQQEGARGVMLVFTIPDLSALIDEDVKAGLLAPIGKRAHKRPIYSLRGNTTGESSASDGDYFAYATAADELLVASSAAVIRAMVHAGEGGGLRMIDNQEYADLFGYVGEIGQLLIVRSVRASYQPLLDENSEQASDELMERAQAAGKLIFEIENTFITDGVTTRKSAVFADEESARSHYATYTNSRKQAEQQMNQMSIEVNAKRAEAESDPQRRRTLRMANRSMSLVNDLLANQETTLDGVVVTTTITFDKKQLNLMTSMISNAKQMQEQAQEKEKDSKEK